MKSRAAAALTALSIFATAAMAEDLEFLIINETSVDLVEFNVSAASSDSWERNLLQGGYLASDYEVGVLIADGLTTCVYDIRGVFSDGASVEDYGLDLCELGEYAFVE
ncbi:hypothetical protein RA28_13490 [Ruegeria sp. ANG-S4]|uniref:hypothetical protein n=1 Tax=Ruegeria sp. ANG-S4 TaxID=1577904 RepID=UPI00057C499E|nr:hypothetical protein [Ruegeria sp. ANG-S4]KIC44011.1 hypothetical protein RA28_13490 [Ruegeria sp. ANG-S4]